MASTMLHSQCNKFIPLNRIPPQITLITKITTLTSKCWISLAHTKHFQRATTALTRMDTQLAMKKAINKDKKMAIKPAREPLNGDKS